MTRPPYIIRLGDAASQALNVLLFNGDANESVSGRSSRIVRWDNPKHKGWLALYKAVNAIAFIQKNHCDEAYDNDLLRAEKLVRDHGQRIQSVREI